MNTVDLCILGALGISALIGLLRGFTREVLGLLTWLGTGASTYMLVPVFNGIARSHVANPMMADGITAIALFIILLVLFSILTTFISSYIHDSCLGGVDRSLGFAFGLARALALICAGEMIFSSFVVRPQQSSVFQEARFSALVRHGSDSLLFLLPLNIQQFVLSHGGKDTSATVTETLQKEAFNQFTKQLPTPGLAPSPILPGTPQSGITLNKNSQRTHLHGITLAPLTPHPLSNNQRAALMTTDPRQTAESIATLKPHATEAKTKDGDYDDKQRRDMNRLFQTIDVE